MGKKRKPRHVLSLSERQELGAALKSARRQAGYTTGEHGAVALGLQGSTLGEYEQGRSEVPIAILRRMRLVYGERAMGGIFRGIFGEGAEAGTAPAAPDTTDPYMPEEALANPTHQALWRRFNAVWRNREKNPELLAALNTLLGQIVPDGDEPVVRVRPTQTKRQVVNPDDEASATVSG